MTENRKRNVEHLKHWPIIEADVSKVNFNEFGSGIELLAGGVPCQPWSLGGKHNGQKDQRNLFPEMIRAVAEIRPKAVLIENVKGLLRQNFTNYFEYILLSLSYPDIAPRANEKWEEHLKRLERRHSSKNTSAPGYNVTFRLLNAADYGVPQKRERVFVVAFRSDIAAEWSFPNATHSRISLTAAKWSSGEYWERHGITKRRIPKPDEREIRQLNSVDMFDFNLAPWRTVRDALSDLDTPVRTGSKNWQNHILVDGARSYHGHTGSSLDEPAKTLKAGDHGVPGGENTLKLPDGTVRYFTVREAARLQGFPDEYYFPSPWTESMRQLGNAVPVDLAEVVAKSIHKHLSMYDEKIAKNSAA